MPHLLLDAGNSLFKNSKSRKKRSQEVINAEGIMSIYKEMGYSAVNVGTYDIIQGSSFLKKSAPYPWISTNFYSKSGSPLFPPFIIKNLGDLKIGITGVTSLPANLPEDIIFKNWSEVLSKTISDISEYCDFIILLSTLSQIENKIIAEQFPTIRLIISASLQHGNILPKLFGNSIITQTEKRGKYLGFLTIFNAHSKSWETKSQNSITRLQKQLRTIDLQLSKYTNVDNQTKILSARYKRLLAKKSTVQREIENHFEKNPAKKSHDVTPSTFNVRFTALSQNIPEDKDIYQEVQTIKKDIQTFNVLREKKIKGHKKHYQFIGRLTGYVKCSECHDKQAEFWKETSHARSFQTLLNNNESKNLDCILCHVTQEPELFHMAQKDSSFLLSLADEFNTVGCESCHGAGLAHSNNPSYFKLNRGVPSEVCQNCHTQERDNNFIYDVKRKKIACPSS